MLGRCVFQRKATGVGHSLHSENKSVNRDKQHHSWHPNNEMSVYEGKNDADYTVD